MDTLLVSLLWISSYFKESPNFIMGHKVLST